MSQVIQTAVPVNGVTVLSLNRPEKRNALNVSLLDAFLEELDKAERDQRALIIKGEGPVFCAGLDLTENIDKGIMLISKVLRRIYHSSLITIAAVHGAALAGGAGMMSACDYVVASEGTRLGYPEVRRGIVAAQVSTLLYRQLRLRDVQELLIFGEMIDAQKALQIGLINEKVSPDKLEDRAIEVAKSGLHGGPNAVVVTKQLIRNLEGNPLSDDLDKALETFRQIHNAAEALEGIAAFKEKREPSWVKDLE